MAFYPMMCPITEIPESARSLPNDLRANLLSIGVNACGFGWKILIQVEDENKFQQPFKKCRELL